MTPIPITEEVTFLFKVIDELLLLDTSQVQVTYESNTYNRPCHYKLDLLNPTSSGHPLCIHNIYFTEYYLEIDEVGQFKCAAWDIFGDRLKDIAATTSRIKLVEKTNKIMKDMGIDRKFKLEGLLHE